MTTPSTTQLGTIVATAAEALNAEPIPDAIAADKRALIRSEDQRIRDALQAAAAKYNVTLGPDELRTTRALLGTFSSAVLVRERRHNANAIVELAAGIDDIVAKAAVTPHTAEEMADVLRIIANGLRVFARQCRNPHTTPEPTDAEIMQGTTTAS